VMRGAILESLDPLTRGNVDDHFVSTRSKTDRKIWWLQRVIFPLRSEMATK
jgi:hypothetical protein